MTVMTASVLPSPLRQIARGKVRDIYEVDDDRLLLVATDRVSAFDVVMREAIPHKGAVLTQLTAWWLRSFDDVIDHHMIAWDIDDIIAHVPELGAVREELAGRAMLCHRATVIP